MFTTMQLWTPSVPVLLVLAISSLQVIVSGAVGTSSLYADEGSNHAITCTPSEAFRFLRWYKSSKNQEFADAQRILELFVFTNSVTFDSSVNASHYSFDKSASDYPLTIKGVGLDDELSYWCDVELGDGSNENGKTSFQVRRIPASIVLKHGGTSYNDGSEVEVIEGENQFECSVPNIKPAAMFTWRLGSNDLDSFTMWNDTIKEDPRLVNSYSTLTVAVDADSELTCSAQNKQDGTSTPDQTISIMLKTRADPCSAAPCLNGGKCSPTADSFQCTCADGFTGDTCGDVITTEEPPTTTTTKPTGTPETASGLSVGVIIGIVAGSLCAVATVVVVGIASWNYYKKTKIKPESDQSEKKPESDQSKKEKEKKADSGQADV